MFWKIKKFFSFPSSNFFISLFSFCEHADWLSTGDVYHPKKESTLHILKFHFYLTREFSLQCVKKIDSYSSDLITTSSKWVTWNLKYSPSNSLKILQKREINRRIRYIQNNKHKLNLFSQIAHARGRQIFVTKYNNHKKYHYSPSLVHVVVVVVFSKASTTRTNKFFTIFFDEIFRWWWWVAGKCSSLLAKILQETTFLLSKWWCGQNSMTSWKRETFNLHLISYSLIATASLTTTTISNGS